MKRVVPVEARTRVGNVKYLDKLRSISKINRNNPTDAEALFWNMVLKNDKLGFRFVRQKPIGRYILDFYCSKLSLAIEIDGNSHELKVNSDYERDKYLLNRGIKTIRYSNDQVYEILESVYNDLSKRLKERALELEI